MPWSSSSTTTANESKPTATTNSTNDNKKSMVAMMRNGFLKKSNNNSSSTGVINSSTSSSSSSSTSSSGNGMLAKRANRSASNAREGLIRWCRKMTDDYENVCITNFSSSWADGLAFCALIHHFMPEAFDYSLLDADNRRSNFELAFRVAE